MTIMENSLNVTETNQSLCSPPRRRRSTFFEKRESFVPQVQLEDETNTSISADNEETEKRRQHLHRYYDKLLCEKELWKKELKERRSKYHDLRQQFKIAANSTSKAMSYASLTTEDIEFLKAKPNIEKVYEHQNNLHNRVKQIMALYKYSNELDSVVLKHCENIVSSVTDYILDHSGVE